MEIKNKHVLIILLIIVFHAINNYIWLSLNQFPVFDDPAFHLLAGLKIIKMFETFSWGAIVRIMSFSVMVFYPPLFHFCMAVFNLLFGKSLISSVMTNILFLTILGFSLYYIGKKLGDKKIGVLSFFIVSMYPYVFGLSRTSLPDFALTAMVAFSLCCLIYTENFTNKPFSLLFGISLGLGMFIKQVFAFFIIAPFIFVIMEIFLKQAIDSSKVKNLILAFLVSIFSGGYWYFLNSKQILLNYMRAAYVDAHMFGPHHFCSLNSLVYYLNQLGRDQMLPFFCFIFVVGAFMFFRSKIKNKLFWPSSIVGAYLIFTVLILTKEPKSTVPYLSFFAIISAAGILNIRNVELKKSLVVFFSCFWIIPVLYNFLYQPFCTQGQLSPGWLIDTQTQSYSDYKL